MFSTWLSIEFCLLVRGEEYCILIFSGDILIFMPGQEDIEVTCDLIQGKNDNC